ncbi:multidrug effflux MFS transporter [Endozoicomonadaceae bacterium StTr2]
MPTSRQSALPVIFALVLLSPLAIDIYLPSLPEMASVFNTDDAALQLTISLFMVCMGVGQLLAGPLSDQFGRRFTALLGTGLYVAGSAAGITSNNLEELYTARALQGLGAASCAVSAFAWVRDHFSAIESGRWISYMGGMIGTIPMLAPLLGGLLATQWGWSANFTFMALFGGIIFLSALLLMDNSRPPALKKKGASGTDQEREPVSSQLKQILGHQQFLTYSLTGMLTMGAILAYATNAPFVAMRLGGLDEFGFALAFGALGLLQLIASFLAPELVSAVGRRSTIMIGIMLALVGSWGLLAVRISDPLWFFLPAAVGCIGFNLIFGTASGLTLEPFKHCSGLAAAIDGCARMTGGGIIASAVKLAGFDVFDTVALSYGLLLIALILVLLEIKRHGFAPPAAKREYSISSSELPSDGDLWKQG